MFDVGFSELLVIGVVALLVIGPEKLPKVARTVGALMGRMQRYVNDVKADINREIELDELKKLQTTVQDAAKSIETSVSDSMAGLQAQTDELNKIASGDIAGLTETRSAETVAAASTESVSATSPESGSPSGSQASLPLEGASTNAFEGAGAPAGAAESSKAGVPTA